MVLRTAVFCVLLMHSITQTIQWGQHSNNALPGFKSQAKSADNMGLAQDAHA